MSAQVEEQSRIKLQLLYIYFLIISKKYRNLRIYFTAMITIKSHDDRGTTLTEKDRRHTLDR